MAGWRKLLEEWTLDKGEMDTTGTQVFLEITGGADSLPIIGDEFDAENTNCKCRRIKYTYAWFENASKKRKAVCSFSTRSGASGSWSMSTDLEERRFTGGGEIISIDDPKGWTWDQSAGAITDQPVFVSNVLGSFTRPLIIDSTEAKDTWISTHLVDKLGTINQADFEGFSIGQVLFSSISGGTQRNEDGDQVWAYTLEFTYRIIRALGGLDYSNTVITRDDWLYVLTRETEAAKGVWDKPKDANGSFLYQKKLFEPMFD